jgi:hypothetical protein
MDYYSELYHMGDSYSPTIGHMTSFIQSFCGLPRHIAYSIVTLTLNVSSRAGENADQLIFDAGRQLGEGKSAVQVLMWLDGYAR